MPNQARSRQRFSRAKSTLRRRGPAKAGIPVGRAGSFMTWTGKPGAYWQATCRMEGVEQRANDERSSKAFNQWRKRTKRLSATWLK